MLYLMRLFPVLAFCILTALQTGACNDDTACNYDPFSTTSDGCEYPQWYFPVVLLGGVAVFECELPDGYELALHQECAQEIVDNDTFCINFIWDAACQLAYHTCATGCTSPEACNYDPFALFDSGLCFNEGWWLPDAPELSNAEPALFGCSGPTGYSYAVNQTCANTVTLDDDYCVDIDWDELCQDTYAL